MFTAKVRKAIYALSAVLVPLLIVLGIESTSAATFVAVGVAVANLVMAFLNVPDDPADG
jgi:hypothetical protein